MEDKIYPYKKSSHFSNMLLKMNNGQDKITSYTDKQFEDVKKWVSETKYKKIGVNTITNSLGVDKETTKILPKPTKIISPWT